MTTWPAADWVEETVMIGDEPVHVLRPPLPDALMDECALADDEFMPYWAELWPSGLALAREVAARTLRGARVVELGCGLGVTSIAAARAGGRALATDWSDDALEATAANVAANGAAVETARVDWRAPDELVARGPFELVLAADVLYEARNVELLLALLPRLVADRGEVWIADPDRPHAADFLARARSEGDWSVRSRALPAPPTVSIHRLLPVRS
jgi:predicted nicotinamide N-methyase